MGYTVEKISGNQVKITFEISADKFGEAVQKAYLKVRGRLNVPGFRKGKAPRKLIESMYGEAVFYDDAFDIVFPGEYEAAVKENDLKVVDRPEVDEVKQIGRYLGLPSVLVDKVPSDGLTGKTDEDNLGFTYKTLDRYIRTGEIDDPAAKERIDRLHERNLFKLQLMPCFEPEL